MQSLQRLCKSI